MVAAPDFQMTWEILLISWKVIETMHMQGCNYILCRLLPRSPHL